MTRPLEQVLADAREEAAVLRKHGQGAIADALERLCNDVDDATEEYRSWLSEQEAMLRSGKGVAYLRNRFGAWQRQGLARWSPRNRRAREYRALIVPHRTDLAKLRADARRAARGEDAA
ncbi:MAG TPA: hypothetical protein VF167_02485 [Longimicrobiaceae bacterium]